MQTRKLLSLYVTSRTDANFQEYFDYQQTNLSTLIPSYINENHLLCFDSNFESGNLDSVYLASGDSNEYNLLVKVDTNTRGNSFWFYFRIGNGRPG